jgi:hypothetical protein
MRTYISDIIPKIQRFSQKLDNLTLLTNQHWVVVDEIGSSKNVYIFRTNNDLLISQNGKVEKAKWEYLGNNSLLIERKEDSYLFKHGFFDENILALKLDSKEEYAFLINETKYDGELNSIDRIIEFLTKTYIDSASLHRIQKTTGLALSEPITKIDKFLQTYQTDKGTIEVEKANEMVRLKPGLKVFQNGNVAQDGKYNIYGASHIHIESGIIKKITMF